MKRILAAAVLAALAGAHGATAASADALDNVREKGVLRVAVYKDFPPYSYTDTEGRMTGLDVEIGKALAAKMGVAMADGMMLTFNDINGAILRALKAASQLE